MHRIGLILVLVISAFLLLYQLDQYPRGIHIDEVRVGNTAWSILKTGKDFYGNTLPVYFNSFGDWRPMGLMYLTVPLVWLGGLSVWTTRLPAALAALTSIITFFVLIRYLYPKGIIAITATAIFALSPWLLVLGRSTSESMPAMALVLFGLWCWVKSRQSGNKRFLIVGTAGLVASFFFYHSPRVFVPLILLYLVRVYGATITHWVFIAVVSAVLIFVVPGGSGRLGQTGLLSDPEIGKHITALVEQEGPGKVLQARILHNKAVVATQAFLSNYFRYFSYDFLFGVGGKPLRYAAVDVGVLQVPVLPFFLMGLLTIIRRKPWGGFILWWLVAAPVAAAATHDYQPHVQRSVFLLPAMAILAGVGVEEVWRFLPRTYRRIGIIVVMAITGLWLYGAVHQYRIHITGIGKNERDVNLTLLASFVRGPSDYDRLIIASLPIPSYEHVLFETGFDPAVVQQRGDIRMMKEWQYGRYTFVQDRCPSAVTAASPQEETLFIDSAICDPTASTREIGVLGDTPLDTYWRLRVPKEQ